MADLQMTWPLELDYATGLFGMSHAKGEILIKILIGAGLLAIIGAGAWWILREPPLQPGELRVTYEHGESCRWQDWTFRIRRQTPNTTARGNMLMVAGNTTETKDDTSLRVYSPAGEKLFVQPHALREMRFVSVPSSRNTSSNNVISLDLVTDAETIRFTPVELPRFSRSRVMVPVASRFFPDQSDDYMTWGNVRLTLAGEVEPDCSTDREISLTRPGHSNNRTPRLIEFGH